MLKTSYCGAWTLVLLTSGRITDCVRALLTNYWILILLMFLKLTCFGRMSFGILTPWIILFRIVLWIKLLTIGWNQIWNRKFFLSCLLMVIFLRRCRTFSGGTTLAILVLIRFGLIASQLPILFWFGEFGIRILILIIFCVRKVSTYHPYVNVVFKGKTFIIFLLMTLLLTRFGFGLMMFLILTILIPLGPLVTYLRSFVINSLKVILKLLFLFTAFGSYRKSEMTVNLKV